MANESLRTSAGIRQWVPYLNLLNASLQTLPIVQKEVYRGVSIPFDLDHFAIGKTLCWGGYVTATEDWQVLVTAAPSDASAPSPISSASSSSSSASQPAPVSNTMLRHNLIFIIKSKTSRRIHLLSSSPQTSRVVFFSKHKVHCEMLLCGRLCVPWAAKYQRDNLQNV